MPLARVGNQIFRVPEGATESQIADAISRSGALKRSDSVTPAAPELVGRSTSGLPSPRPEQSEFAKGVSVGTDSLQGSLYGLAALTGDSVGNEALTDWGVENYQRNVEEAGRTGLKASSLDDIDDIGSFMDFASGALGQAVPSLASTAAGGGVGGIVGKAVAKRAVTGLVSRGLKQEIAEQAVTGALKNEATRKTMMAAMKRGAVSGAFVASAGQQQGALYTDLKEAGIEDAALPAWAFGAAQGALDVVGEVALAKKLLPGQVEKELSKSLARGLAKGTGEQAAIEGGTEAAQSGLGSLARILNGEDESWSGKDTKDLLNNAAAGAIVGAVLGAPASLAERAQAQKPKNETAGKPSGEKQNVRREPASATDAQAQPARPAASQRVEQPLGTAPASAPRAAAAVPPSDVRPGAGPIPESQPVQDQPTAEPALDIRAQLRDLASESNPRKAVYFSAENAEQHAGILRSAQGFAKVPDADGKGGVLLLRQRDKIDFQKRLAAGEPREKIIGEMTLSGSGKPTVAGSVVAQQKDADGAVTRESVITPGTSEAAATLDAMAAPGRTVDVVPPDAALRRREEMIALDDLTIPGSEEQIALVEQLRSTLPDNAVGRNALQWAVDNNQLEAVGRARDSGRSPYNLAAGVIAMSHGINAVDQDPATPRQRLAMRDIQNLLGRQQDADAEITQQQSTGTVDSEEIADYSELTSVVERPYRRIGKGDVIEGALIPGAPARTKASPFDDQTSAEEIASKRQQSDPDATYVAEETQSGWFVNVYRRPNAETVFSPAAGGSTTIEQLVRLFIARASKRWNNMKKEDKDGGPGKPVYGFKAVHLDADGKPVMETYKGQARAKTSNLASAEIVNLGLAIDPDLRKNGQVGLRDAFRLGLSHLLSRESGKLVPVSFREGKPTFSSRLVLRERMGPSGKMEPDVLLKDATQAADIAARNRTLDARRAADQEKNDPTPAQLGEEPPPPAEDVPEFDRAGASRVGDLDVRGIESEADQNFRSTGESPRGTNIGTALKRSDSPIGTVPAGPAAETYNPVSALMRDPARARAFEGMSKSLRDIMKLRKNIIVSDDKDMFIRALRSAGLDTYADAAADKIDNNLKGGFVVNGLGGHTAYIFINPAFFARNDMAGAIKVMSHELGHVFFQQYWGDTKNETRKALIDSFEGFLQDNPKFYEHLNYEKRFEEWMANQIASWVASNRTPRTAVEHWFKNLAEVFAKIWNAIQSRYPLDLTANDYINETLRTFETKADSAFDSLGAANSVFRDDLDEPVREPPPKLRELWTKARSIKAKHPKLGGMLDFVGESATAMHNGLTASLHARIRRMGIPAFDRIVSAFHHRPGDAGGFTFDTAVANRLRSFTQQYDAIVARVKDKAGFLEVLRREQTIDQMPKEFQEPAAQMRLLLRRLYEYQRDAHLPIREVVNYFPQVADVEELLKPDAVDTIHNALQRAGVTKTIAGRQVAVTHQDVQELVDNMTDDSFAIDFDPARLEDTAGNSRSPFVQALRARVMPEEWRAAIRNVKNVEGQSRFYAKSLDEVIHRYVRQATRRAEYNRLFGDTTWDSVENQSLGDKARPFNPHMQFGAHMEQAREQGADAGQQELMYDAMAAFMGNYNRIRSEPLKKLTRSVAFYQNLRTLLWVTISSIPELTTLFLRTGNFGQTWRVMRDTAADSFRKGGSTSHLLRAYGFAVDELDALAFKEFYDARDYSSKINRLNESWFRMIGLTRWTNFMRGLSLNVSQDYMKQHARRVADGLDTTGDSQRRLDELGVSVDDLRTWAEFGEPVYGQKGITLEDARAGRSGIAPENLEAIQRVTGAVTRMINEIVVNPTAAMKPLWRSDERWALVSQLGSFTYGFLNQVLSRVWYELSRTGAPTMARAAPLIALAMMIPVAALGLELKELFQYTIWGKPARTDGMTGPQYIQTLIARTGVLGVAQLGVDAYESASYGRDPIGVLTGPTLSQVNAAFRNVAQAEDKSRAVIKTTLGAIPFLSATPGARDLLVPPLDR